MAESVITVPAFASDRDGVRHFFGTRRHVQAIELAYGVPATVADARGRGWLLSVKQVHGTDVLVVDRPVAEADRFHGEWDALVTDQPGVTVAVRTADCVPILIYDRRRRAVAAIHAGWRGAVAGIVTKTINLMRVRFDIDEAEFRVSIGPAAGACCYEVDEAVLAPLRKGFSGWEEVVQENGPAKARLDLKRLIRRQVERMGIAPCQVTTVNLCTICHGNLFYSYRRERRVSGTMLSGIALVARR
jgi:YfiH family protein